MLKIKTLITFNYNIGLLNQSIYVHQGKELLEIRTAEIDYVPTYIAQLAYDYNVDNVFLSGSNSDFLGQIKTDIEQYNVTNYASKPTYNIVIVP